MINRANWLPKPDELATPPLVSIVNFGLAATHVCVNICQFFIVPLYFLPKSGWWALLLVLFAASNNALWALIHECIHDVFHSSDRINSAVGRTLGVLFGSPFHVLRLTHLSHHKFNRSPLEKGTEIYNPETTSRAKASVGYFVYILCGLYLIEVFSSVLFFLPSNLFRKLRQRVADGGNTQERWLARKFMNERLIREIRLDGIAICLIFGLSAFCYREHWRLLVGLLMVRTFLISFMDNVYHYRTPLSVTVSGYNLWLPRSFSLLLLNFNLHRVHHRNPSVPWAKLPELFVRQSETFDRNLFVAACHQLCGPVPQRELARGFAQREATNLKRTRAER